MSNDLEIRIKTTAELAGAESATAALEKQLGAAKALGAEYSELQKIEEKLGRAKQAIADFKASPTAPRTPEFAKVTNDAEYKAAKGIEASLMAQVMHSKLLGQSYGEHEAKLKGIQAAIGTYAPKTNWLGGLRAELENTFPIIGRLSGAMSGFAAGGLAMVAAGFAAVGTAILGAKQAITEFSQAQDQVAKLDAALAQTGQLTDDYRQRLQDLADEMENATGIDDARWINVIKRLTQFGATAKDIDKTTEAVKNLAGIMEGDVEGAAQAVSKAMQGSFDMFRRYGIVVEEAGSQSEKLDKLFQNLATRGGGQLEAMSKTLSGQFVTLRNNIGDFFKGVGGGIASTGVLQNALQILGDSTEYWSDMIKQTIPKVDGLSNAFEKSKTQALSTEEASKKYAEQLKAIGENAKLADDALKAFNSTLDKQKSHEDRMDDLSKSKELASLEVEKKRRERTGRPMSELEELGRKTDIEVKYSDRKISRSNAVDQGKLKALDSIQVKDELTRASDNEEVARQTARLAKAKQISDAELELKKAADFTDTETRKPSEETYRIAQNESSLPLLKEQIEQAKAEIVGYENEVKGKEALIEQKKKKVKEAKKDAPQDLGTASEEESQLNTAKLGAAEREKTRIEREKRIKTERESTTQDIQNRSEEYSVERRNKFLESGGKALGIQNTYTKEFVEAVKTGKPAPLPLDSWPSQGPQIPRAGAQTPNPNAPSSLGEMNRALQDIQGFNARQQPQEDPTIFAAKMGEAFIQKLKEFDSNANEGITKQIEAWKALTERINKLESRQNAGRTQ
jgi:hypothetical protein